MSAMIWAFILLAGAVVSSEASGTPTSIEKFPSLAQVEINLGVVWVQQCAGVIITNTHVLSSAYCFSGDLYMPQYRRIRVGSSYRGRDGEVLGVKQALNYPDFGLLGKDGDVTVVRLEEYLTLGPSIQQAAIIGQGIELPFGLQVQHAGWGFTAEGGSTSSIDLYSVDLYVHNIDNCLEKYYNEYIITENMVCAGSGYYTGRSYDSRDLGAPLFYSDTLVGLLSFGKATEDDSYPVVATSVGSYTEWIITTASLI